MAASFTYTILRACLTPDDEEVMGAIVESAALELVSSFPFVDELAKRDENPDLTVPTLTFIRSADQCYFVIWSELVGQFVLYCPTHEWLVEGVTDIRDAHECLRTFFASDDKNLASSFAGLVRKYQFDSSRAVVLPGMQDPNTSLPLN